jgi:glycosyltransferase involved in cell wall biosynthesis
LIPAPRTVSSDGSVGGTWWGFAARAAVECLRSVPAVLQGRVPSSERPRDEVRVLAIAEAMDVVHGVSVQLAALSSRLPAHGVSLGLLEVAAPSHGGGRTVGMPTDWTGFRRRVDGVASWSPHPDPLLDVRFPLVSQVIDALRDFRPHIVEIETVGLFGLLVAAVARIRGIPVVFHHRTDYVGYLRHTGAGSWSALVLGSYARLMVAHCGRVVLVPSVWSARDAQALGVPRRAIEVVPRGVDLVRFHPGSNPVEQGPPTLLYVGRLVAEKGLPVLIEAYASLRRRHPDLALRLVGAGPLGAAAAEVPGIECTGVLRGEELASAYRDATIFVFPSRTETFGNAVLEAMASGLPVVVSHLGGPAEILGDCGGGEVLPEISVEALVEAIERLLSDPESRRDAARRARSRAEEFAVRTMDSRLAKFYRKVSAAPGSSEVEGAR